MYRLPFGVNGTRTLLAAVLHFFGDQVSQKPADLKAKSRLGAANIQLEQDSRPPYGGNMRGGCWMVDFSWHQIYVYYTIVFPPNIEINEDDLYGVLMVFCFTLIIQESVFEWISKKHGVHAASAPQKVCS